MIAAQRADWARDQALLSNPPILASPLDVLNLGKRVQHILESEDIYSVDALVRKHWTELRKFRGIGRVSVKRIQKALQAHGLQLDMKPCIDPEKQKASPD